nr:winged helix-turn-helix domain-containing protein [uncultured Blautia sp.]
MKKNISVISMDPILQEWLLQKLIKEPPESHSAKELLSGIYDMISGDVNSLLLSTAKESEIPSINRSDEMKIGELVINPKSRSVIRMGQEVSLTPKEFDILYFLAENRGEVFTKEQIYKAVWSENYLLDDSNIMAFIRKLRKKIEPNPDEPKYILTIWGIGYKFNDKV